MLTLQELKNKIINEYNLQEDKSSCGFSLYLENENIDTKLFTNNKLLVDFYSKMMKNPNKIKQIEEQIGKGENFRCYFSNIEDMKKFASYHDTDPDKFYSILRKEELFLNTCLHTFGYNNIMISLDPNKLLNDIDEISSDETL